MYTMYNTMRTWDQINDSRSLLVMALCGNEPCLLVGDGDGGYCAGSEGQVIGLDTVAEDHTVLRHLADDLQLLAGPDVAPHYPRRRRLADERLPDAEAQLRRVPGETESLADRRHGLLPGERLDDASRAVEDGAEPAGGPRARRDDDAARRLVLGAPPVREVVMTLTS